MIVVAEEEEASAEDAVVETEEAVVAEEASAVVIAEAVEASEAVVETEEAEEVVVEDVEEDVEEPAEAGEELREEPRWLLSLIVMRASSSLKEARRTFFAHSTPFPESLSMERSELALRLKEPRRSTVSGIPSDPRSPLPFSEVLITFGSSPDLEFSTSEVPLEPPCPTLLTLSVPPEWSMLSNTLNDPAEISSAWPRSEPMLCPSLKTLVTHSDTE